MAVGVLTAWDCTDPPSGACPLHRRGCGCGWFDLRRGRQLREGDGQPDGRGRRWRQNRAGDGGGGRGCYSRAGALLVKMLTWSAIVDLERERTGVGVRVRRRQARSEGPRSDEVAMPLGGQRGVARRRRAAIAGDVPVRCGWGLSAVSEQQLAGRARVRTRSSRAYVVYRARFARVVPGARGDVWAGSRSGLK